MIKRLNVCNKSTVKEYLLDQGYRIKKAACNVLWMEQEEDTSIIILLFDTEMAVDTWHFHLTYNIKYDECFIRINDDCTEALVTPFGEIL